MDLDTATLSPDTETVNNDTDAVPNRVDAALQLARHGYEVFPAHTVDRSNPWGCSCGGKTLDDHGECANLAKHPATANGLYDATTDLDTIRQEWAVFPDANVAVRTGAPSGIVVLDVDPRHGGRESLRRITAERGAMLETVTVETGGGGDQFYFRHPGDRVGNKTGLLPGLDIRGDGGYVIAPPSMHKSGNAYRWADGRAPWEIPLAPMPTWMFDTAAEKKRARLDDDERITEGGRNDRLFQVGCLMRAAGMTAAEIAEALRTANQARCNPPLPDDEVDQIAQSASRYEPDAETTTPVTPVAVDPVEWPEMTRDMLHGIAGDIVGAIDPTTEADPIAVLVSFLVAFGSCCGRGPNILIGDTRHGTNFFAVLVGDTAAGRKGTSFGPIRRMFTEADKEWAEKRISGGLSTGEGLIYAIRDPTYSVDRKTGESYLSDAGVIDKRLLCIEEEMSFGLKTAQRPGNTLSEIVRRAWDSQPSLSVLTKTDNTASNPHVSILGHITKVELARNLTETEAANGYANRYGWFLVRRSKFLPEPLGLPDEQVRRLARDIRKAKEFAVAAGELRFDPAASALWAHEYPNLVESRPGLAGALTARGAPIVRRLTLIYALLDRSTTITCDHLTAALELWDYAAQSARIVFGDLTGDAVADRILAALKHGPQSQTDLYELFGRNVPAARIGQAVDLLHTEGRIVGNRHEPAGGKGRPKTVWTLAANGGDRG